MLDGRKRFSKNFFDDSGFGHGIDGRSGESRYRFKSGFGSALFRVESKVCAVDKRPIRVYPASMSNIHYLNAPPTTGEPTDPPREATYTRQELMRIFGVKSDTIRKWIKSKRLPHPDIVVTSRSLAWSHSALVRAGMNLPKTSSTKP